MLWCAILALGTYIFVRKILLKGQKEEIIKKAELEAESIKKEKIFQAKEKFLSLKSGHEQYINERNKQINEIKNRLKLKESLKAQLDAANARRTGQYTFRATYYHSKGYVNTPHSKEGRTPKYSPVYQHVTRNG